MPLADDVNIDELCRADLSGGEIKNVVLNAAREEPELYIIRDPARALKPEVYQEVRYLVPAEMVAILEDLVSRT